MDWPVPASAMEIGIAELRALVGLKPSRQDGRELPADLKDLFFRLDDQGDKVLLLAVESRSAEDFRSRREAVIGTYVRIQGAIASLADAIISKMLMKGVVDEGFAALDAQFKTEALARFGEDARDQALFTTWTLRRTMPLLERIQELGPVAADAQDEDQEMGRRCTVNLWWTFFHVDCLRTAIRHDKPLRSEVVETVIDGLRAAVNAYALARQGLTLREGRRSRSVDVLPEWSGEDQQLLAESMADLDRSPVADDDVYQAG